MPFFLSPEQESTYVKGYRGLGHIVGPQNNLSTPALLPIPYPLPQSPTPPPQRSDLNQLHIRWSRVFDKAVGVHIWGDCTSAPGWLLTGEVAQ